MSTRTKTTEWREARLDEVSSIQTGPFGSQLHESDYVQDGTPIITVEHLLDDRISHTTDIPKVSAEDTSRLKKRYSLTEGDIVFSRVGSVDRSAYVSKAEDGWLFSGRLLRVRPDKQQVSSKWLDYWLRQKKIKEFVRRIAVGATMPSINTSLLGEVPVLLPSMQEQHEIAAVFSAIENKVELLRRQNKTLEQIAHTIFNEWFVKPSTEATLPKGWCTSTIFDFVEILSGGTPKTNNTAFYGGDIPFFTPKDADSATYVLSTERYLTEEGLKSCNSISFPQNTVFITARGTVGEIVLAGVPMAMNQSCYALRAKNKEQQHFLYLLLKQLQRDLTGRAHGSVFQTITLDTFRSLDVVIPSEDLLSEFSSIISPLFDKILQNSIQANTLASLRNALLPRLMNGEIKV